MVCKGICHRYKANWGVPINIDMQVDRKDAMYVKSL